VLQIVEHDELDSIREVCPQSHVERRAGRIGNLQGPRQCRQHEARIPRRRQRENHDAVAESALELIRHAEREPRLANATGTGEREQADVRIAQEAGRQPDHRLPADE
jgi:hypothetical protein